MDGITILDTGEYLVRTTGGFNPFFLISLSIIIIPTIFFIVLCFLKAEEEFSSIEVFLIEVFSIIIGIPCSLAAWHSGGERITIPEYKVTIDDSITYKDFTNKYKVIEQEGQIYTIIDKEELAAAADGIGCN